MPSIALVPASLILICALWFALRALPAGADAAVPVLPYMIALVPFLWIPALACAVWAAAIGAWAPCVTGVVVAVAVLASQTPYWRRRSMIGTRKDGVPDTYASADAGVPCGTNAHDDGARTRLTVMTLNCRYGRANANAIVDLVRERRVRALALQEVSADLVARLEEAGLGTVLPYRSLGEDREDDNGGFNGVWCAVEPAETQRCAARIPAAQTPAVVVALPVGGASGDGDGNDNDNNACGERGIMMVRFVAVHTFSPMRGVHEWTKGIRGLASLTHDEFDVPAVDGVRRVTVAMGDLNSGIDHPSFRSLLRAGFRDAALDEAHGKHATFPRWLRWPRIVLDHVLVFEHQLGGDGRGAAMADRAVTCRGVRSYAVTGTDHLALVATLAW